MTEPEHRLFVAVLIQAICDFHGLTMATRAEQRNARAWIASDGNRPASFVNICEVLELDHVAVRRRIQKMRPAEFTTRVSGSFGFTEPQTSMPR